LRGSFWWGALVRVLLALGLSVLVTLLLAAIVYRCDPNQIRPGRDSGDTLDLG